MEEARRSPHLPDHVLSLVVLAGGGRDPDLGGLDSKGSLLVDRNAEKERDVGQDQRK